MIDAKRMKELYKNLEEALTPAIKDLFLPTANCKIERITGISIEQQLPTIHYLPRIEILLDDPIRVDIKITAHLKFLNVNEKENL